MEGAARLEITIPARTDKFLKELAKTSKKSESQVITECIEARRNAALMIEGYLEMGEENLRLSEEFLTSEKDICPAWEDK